jgi:hypothetical protein
MPFIIRPYRRCTAQYVVRSDARYFVYATDNKK